MRIDTQSSEINRERIKTQPCVYSREVLGYDDYICEQLEVHEWAVIGDPLWADEMADGSNDEEETSNSLAESVRQFVTNVT